MWEQLKVYHSLDKKEINSTFKKFGFFLHSKLDGYSVELTTSIIKLYRIKDQFEQGIFIQKTRSTNLEVTICIKPIDFYKRHKFTLINPVKLGDILNNYRRTSFPLTQEWTLLAEYLFDKINNKVEDYFKKYDTYEKIILKRKDIEPKERAILTNKYELLIYAAVKTHNKELLKSYLDLKMKNPAMLITKSEYLKPDVNEIDEEEFLNTINSFASNSNFEDIEKMLSDFK